MEKHRLFNSIRHFTWTAALVCALSLLTASSSRASVDRGLWVWNAASILGNSSAESALFTFCDAPKGNSRKSVSTVFCAFSLSQLTGSTSAVRSFISTAHAHDICVYFVCGDPAWATSAGESTALTWLNGVLSFNQGGTATTNFDGFQYDVEPYLNAGWPSTSLINGMITLLQDSQDAIDCSGVDISYCATIPFWYDDPTYSYLDRSIIDLTDEVAIMDYVSTAANLENYPAAEVSYANSAGKYCWIGVETNPGYGSSSFYDSGNAAMENVFSADKSYYQSQSSFEGWAIQDYTGYVNLAP
jgi:hypothetical protein